MERYNLNHSLQRVPTKTDANLVRDNLQRLGKKILRAPNDAIFSELVQPLNTYNIQNFFYCVVKNNVRTLSLSNNFAWHELFFNRLPHYNNEDFIENYLTDKIQAYRSTTSIATLGSFCAKNNLIAQDMFAMSMKTGLYITVFNQITQELEVFCFFSESIENEYVLLTKLHELQHFCLLVKDKMQPWIKRYQLLPQEMAKHPIDSLRTNTHSSLADQPLNNSLAIKRYYLGAPFALNVYFTQREMDCLKLSFLGYTAKQMALQLRISYRSVEKHLETAKRKADCRNFNELRLKLISCTFFLSLLGLQPRLYL